MRLLNSDQIEKILEVTRKGTPVEGTVLYKLAYDIKKVRDIAERLVELKNADKGLFSKSHFSRDAYKIIEELEDLI